MYPDASAAETHAQPFNKPTDDPSLSRRDFEVTSAVLQDARLHNSQLPIFSLPLELILQFFSLALTSDGDVVRQSTVRASTATRGCLMLVCTPWRDLVTANPFLWAELCCHSFRPVTPDLQVPADSLFCTTAQALQCSAQIRHLWLNRAMAPSLEFSLKMLSTRGSPRLESLFVSTCQPPGYYPRHVPPRESREDWQFPALRNIMLLNVDAPICLVSSRTVRLEITFYHNTRYYPMMGTLLNILARATGLEVLRLDHYIPSWTQTAMSPPATDAIHFPHMREMRLAGDGENLTVLMEYLSVSFCNNVVRICVSGVDEGRASDIGDSVNRLLDFELPLPYIEIKFKGAEDLVYPTVLRGGYDDLDNPSALLEIHLDSSYSGVEEIVSQLELDEVYILRILASEDLDLTVWDTLHAVFPSLKAVCINFTPSCLLPMMGYESDYTNFFEIEHLFIDCNGMSSNVMSCLVGELMKGLEQCDALRLLHLHGVTLTGAEEDWLEGLVEICFDSNCSILKEILKQPRLTPESRISP